MTKVVNHSGQRGKIGAGCLITILVVVALAAGGGYLAFQKGMEMMAEQASDAIRDDPSIKEHIGEIESLEVDLKATSALKQKTGEEKAVFVFEIVGSKGKGRVAVTMAKEPKPGGIFTAATLTMEDGQSYPLEVKIAAPAETPAPGSTPAEDPAGGKTAGEKSVKSSDASKPEPATK